MTLQKLSSLMIIALITTFTSCNSAKKTKYQEQHKHYKAIDSILISLNQKEKFNGTLLVAKNDRIIYNKSFGYATGDKQTLLKTTDKFNIGSIFKEIPAVAIMQLNEKGILQLNDPIKKHLKHLPNWSNDITILQLLQYTSGLPKINWRKHPEVTDESLMNDLFEISNLEFIPGKNYLYTNYSPFLLTKIVESISQKSFIEYVDENILKALKLKNSKFNNSFPYKNRNSMAISFNNEYVEDNLPFTIKSSIFLFSTTTEDLFKLLDGMHSYKLINKNSLNIISKTANLNIDNMESAIGNVTFLDNKIIEHTHHGSSGNYECIIAKDILSNNTIIILTNSKNGNIHKIKNSIQKLLK